MKLSRAGSIALLMISAVASARQEKLIAALEEQEAIEGCAWSAVAPSIGEGFVFLAELDDSINLMNIGGKDVNLSLEASTGQLASPGDVQKRRFVAPGVSVVATFTASWVCPRDDESCEVTLFNAVFDVTAGKSQQRVIATGHVGC